MRYDPDRHHRRPLRLRGYDYGRPGAYFVTTCVHQRECLFGDVSSHGEVILNDAGRRVQEVWESLPARFPLVEVDAFVVMPNHVHGIVLIVGAAATVGARLASPEGGPPAPASPQRLGDIVGAFKSLSATRANQVLSREGQPLWQRNYHEHIVRTEAALDRIRGYIAGNPARWAEDEENPHNVRSTRPAVPW